MKLQAFRQLSAGHALHTFSADDEHAFTRALAPHPEWQEIVDDDLETAARLGEATTEAAPPSTLRGILLDLIKTTPQLAHSERPGHTTRNDRRRTMWAGAFALAASLALLTTVTLGTQAFNSADPNNSAVTAIDLVTEASDAQTLTVDVAGGGEATLRWSRNLDRAVLIADRLPKLSSDRDFEVWLVRNETPISVGVVGSNSDPRMLTEFHVGDVVALTVEQSGGSPSGLPTRDPLFAITTA